MGIFNSHFVIHKYCVYLLAFEYFVWTDAYPNKAFRKTRVYNREHMIDFLYFSLASFISWFDLFYKNHSSQLYNMSETVRIPDMAPSLWYRSCVYWGLLSSYVGSGGTAEDLFIDWEHFVNHSNDQVTFRNKPRQPLVLKDYITSRLFQKNSVMKELTSIIIPDVDDLYCDLKRRQLVLTSVCVCLCVCGR